MNTRFKVFASYNILQYMCDFIHVLIFVTVSKCRKSPKIANIVNFSWVAKCAFPKLHGYDGITWRPGRGKWSNIGRIYQIEVPDTDHSSSFVAMVQLSNRFLMSKKLEILKRTSVWGQTDQQKLITANPYLPFDKYIFLRCLAIEQTVVWAKVYTILYIKCMY